ncbi:MAG TPA: hypothetical protein PLR74_11815 [Agriterribacter sp.]|nr:hypothetical protein [Agriterribacter sp.]
MCPGYDPVNSSGEGVLIMYRQYQCRWIGYKTEVETHGVLNEVQFKKNRFIHPGKAVLREDHDAERYIHFIAYAYPYGYS